MREKDEYERWQPAATKQSKHQGVAAQLVQTKEQKPVVAAGKQTYAVARASRVVGSSGLIRVPAAALSDDAPFAGEAPKPTGGMRAMQVPVPMQPSARVAMEPRTMPMSAPTQAMPRVPMEPRTQFEQTMPAMQPVVRQMVGQRTLSSSVPQSSLTSTPMREQLRIVQREVENYDTVPIIPDAHDSATHETFAGKRIEESNGESEGLVTRSERKTVSSREPLRLLVGIGLDTGIVRKDVPNEDNLFAIQGMRPTSAGPEPVGLFIVADGMGGHAHGQEASKLAVHGVSDAIVPTLMRQTDKDENFLDLLKEGVHRANLAIYQRNREQEHMMGTTLTAVLLVAGMAYGVNVGDSRTYLYRPAEGMTQLSRDHSVVASLVESGVIAREDMYTHPKRNQIYRCLGERASVEVDVFSRRLQADDVLILCSDGLWEMVHDEEMEGIIASSAAYPAQLSKLLIQAALMRGGADNISVIVACVAQTEGR